MATTEGSTDSEGQRELTKRDRAFLGQLPDDFLRVEEVPRSEQRTQSGQRDHPHLVPMTYAPQQLAYGQGESNLLGKLKVTIAQAKLVKNYGITRMDPYCRVRVGHAVYETPTDVNGSKNPRWNKVFYCNLPRGVTGLYVEIFNERYLSLDDRVAWGYNEFNEDLFNGETVEEWIPLTGKQGDEKEGNVNIILTLQPLQAHYQLSNYAPQPIVMNQPYFPGQYPPGFVPQYPVSPVAPVQPTGPPPISEEDVKQLQEMFPTIEKEVVKSVLEAARGNTDQAVSNLLSMTSD